MDLRLSSAQRCKDSDRGLLGSRTDCGMLDDFANLGQPAMMVLVVVFVLVLRLGNHGFGDVMSVPKHFFMRMLVRVSVAVRKIMLVLHAWAVDLFVHQDIDFCCRNPAAISFM